MVGSGEGVVVGVLVLSGVAVNVGATVLFTLGTGVGVGAKVRVAGTGVTGSVFVAALFSGVACTTGGAT